MCSLQAFFSVVDDVLLKYALITFLPSFLTFLIAGTKSSSPDTIIAVSYKFSYALETKSTAK